jgi:hypothetical protein
VERVDGLAVLSRRAIAAALAALSVAAAPSSAQVFMTQTEALAQAFPGARIERRSLVLSEAQRATVQARARVHVESRLAAAYVAWRGDTLAGTAFFDSRIVRTMPAVFMIAVAPDGGVSRVDVLSFHEPPDYRPTAPWLAQFGHRRLGDGLWPNRDIRSLSGASLTTRAVTEGVRIALALYAELVAPTLHDAAPNAGAATSGASR